MDEFEKMVSAATWFAAECSAENDCIFIPSYEVNICQAYDNGSWSERSYEKAFTDPNEAVSFLQSYDYEIRNIGCDLIPCIDWYEFGEISVCAVDEDGYIEYYDGDLFFYVEPELPKEGFDATYDLCREIIDGVEKSTGMFVWDDVFSGAERSYETFYLTYRFGPYIESSDNDGLCKIRFSTHGCSHNSHRHNDADFDLSEYYDVDRLINDVVDVVLECKGYYEDEMESDMNRTTMAAHRAFVAAMAQKRAFSVDVDYELAGGNAEEAFDKLIDRLTDVSFDNLGDALNDVCNDDKLYALLCEGFGDGDYANVQMSAGQTAIPVQRLLPCQNEIGLGNSLSYALKSDCSTYFNDPCVIVGPIVTYCGNFIIDGHHRWSQAYMINPNANIAAVDFDYMEGSPWRCLRNFQGAIAVAEGEVPSSSADVANVYNMGEDEIRAYIESNIQDVCVDGLCGLVGLGSRKEVIEYLIGNINMLKQDNYPINSAPDRDAMPQTTPAAIEVMEEGQTNI